MIQGLGIVFAICLLIGLPIGVSVGLASLYPHWSDPSFVADAQYIIRGMLGGLDSTPMLAIPMFMLSGAIMASGGISEKLFNVFAYFLGRVTAGLPCAAIVTCLFFGAISGSGPATCAAVGGMVIPVMVKLGYDKNFVAAICATAGGLGVIIPPSIPFILYSMVSGVSVSDMFIGGIIPGIVIALCLMIWAFIRCKYVGEDKEKINAHHEKLKELGIGRLMVKSFWALLTPVIILGCIYGGWTTPTEAAVISVTYALGVTVFIYRSVRVREIPAFLVTTVKSYCPLLLVFMMACAFSRVLTLTGAPAAMANFVVYTFGGSPMLFLVIFTIFLLFLGMVMDVAPAILILAPILVPAAELMGINPVHFGMIMVVALAIGFVTPPFGVNLFVAAPLVNAKVMEIAQKAFPFIVFFIVALSLIVFIPSITLLLI
ncbi:MAG: TRAP transporter large permease [Planctomycetaceae bacterium]|nr:TRAP transporter large permease [Planctomycetaceae bacterium]